MALRLSSHRLCTATSLLKPNAQVKASTSCDSSAAMAQRPKIAFVPSFHPQENIKQGPECRCGGGVNLIF